VKLPKGLWYDYWTGERQEGGKPLKVEPALDDLPLYVRAGAIIPHQPVVQHVEQKPAGPLEIRVYPGPDCRGSVYTDDGNTFAYQKGAFQRTSFTCEASQDGVQVKIAAPEGTFKPWWNSMQVAVVGVQAAPKQVTIGGTAVSDFTFDATSRTVSVQFAAGQAKEVAILY
jgi:alpha-glucosidase